jgi:hypothetical protein
MHSKVPFAWLPHYIKATQPVFRIFKMAGYFPDRHHTIIFDLLACCTALVVAVATAALLVTVVSEINYSVPCTCFSCWSSARTSSANRYDPTPRGGSCFEQPKCHPEHSERYKVSTVAEHFSHLGAWLLYCLHTCF